MFWKNAGKPHPVRASWSIASRMTVFYIVGASAVLFLATQSLYWQMAHALRQDNEEFAEGVVETIKLIMSEHGADARYLAVEVETESKVRDRHRYFARISGPAGIVVIETSGMDEATPPANSPLWHKTHTALARRWNPRENSFYRLISSLHQLDGKPYEIQLAIDVSTTEGILRQYARKIVIVLLCGAVASAFIGLVMVRLSLRPLARITDAVQRTSAAQLHERIAGRNWPTELAMLACAFDDMLARLEDSFTRLTQFSADLAHELRTPVNNIRGQSEVTLSRTRDATEYREALASNIEETERLTRIIESLLFLARSEHAGNELTLSDLDAQTEVRSVVEYVEPMAAEKTVSTTVTGTARIRADSSLLRRALSNLLLNAIRHTPSHGRIIVHVSESDNLVRISVSDSGCGIAAEHLPKIFDRFYRADPSRTGNPTNAGLGLAIVKSIAELHHGTVTVESEIGRGSVFTLSFPRAAG
ncbi:MAG TPA: heavy metal sensor histidine kinase [Candidatus Acidoferrum sp.]|nr:heavy metal sensor histidine kinase [Candidatus Acidoferrum sp.]